MYVCKVTLIILIQLSHNIQIFTWDLGLYLCENLINYNYFCTSHKVYHSTAVPRTVYV